MKCDVPMFGLASTAPYRRWYGAFKSLSCPSPVLIALLKLVVSTAGRRHQHHVKEEGVCGIPTTDPSIGVVAEVWTHILKRYIQLEWSAHKAC